MRLDPGYRATMMLSVLALCQTAPADATARKKTQPHAYHYTSATSMRANPLAANGYAGYYERVLDRVPYGSQLWWRVYHSYPRN